MDIHVRLLAVVAGALLGELVSGWGIVTSVRPELWGRRGVRWCVGWTAEPVGRTFGIAVALVGTGIVVSAVAGAMSPPAVAIPPAARVVQLTGLALVVVGGALVVALHPAPLEAADLPRPDRPRHL